jgi:hypothetical protein
MSSPASKVQFEEWKRLLKTKQAQFQVSNRDKFQLVEFSEFTKYLQTLSARYERKKWSKAISRFTDKMEHIRSFERAISAMTQTEDTASLLWGGIQFAMEVRHS